jgi:hypothetical protein
MKDLMKNFLISLLCILIINTNLHAQLPKLQDKPIPYASTIFGGLGLTFCGIKYLCAWSKFRTLNKQKKKKERNIEHYNAIIATAKNTKIQPNQKLPAIEKSIDQLQVENWIKRALTPKPSLSTRTTPGDITAVFNMTFEQRKESVRLGAFTHFRSIAFQTATIVENQKKEEEVALKINEPEWNNARTKKTRYLAATVGSAVWLGGGLYYLLGKRK